METRWNRSSYRTEEGVRGGTDPGFRTAAAFLLLVVLMNAAHARGAECRDHPRDPDKIRNLGEPSLSPVPYDPTAGSLVLQVTFAVRKVDGLQALEKGKNPGRFEFRVRVDVSITSPRGAVGQVSRTITLAPPFSVVELPARRGKAMLPFIQVPVRLEWDGKDRGSGVAVPDGIYGFEVQAEFERVRDGKKGEKVKEIDDTEPVSGSFPVKRPDGTLTVTPAAFVDVSDPGAPGLPARIVQAQVVPATVFRPGAVFFLAPDGRVLRRIDLVQNEGLIETVHRSPGERVVAVRSCDIGKVKEFLASEKSEGGDTPTVIRIYDATGRQISEFKGDDGDTPTLSDTGLAVIQNEYRGTTWILRPDSGGPAVELPSGGHAMAISADGARVAFGYTRSTVDGHELPAFGPKFSDTVRATQEIWVIMYSAQGEVVWDKKLPVDGKVDTMAVDEHGNTTFVGTRRYPFRPGVVPDYLLDTAGDVLRSMNDWSWGVGPSWRPDLGGFVFADPGSHHIYLGRIDGSFQGPGNLHERSPLFHSKQILRIAVGKQVCALLVLRHPRLVLVLVDWAGRIRAARNISWDWTATPPIATGVFPMEEGPGFPVPPGALYGQPYDPLTLRLSEAEDLVGVGFGTQLRFFDVQP